jgi:hypothetical protein
MRRALVLARAPPTIAALLSRPAKSHASAWKAASERQQTSGSRPNRARDQIARPVAWPARACLNRFVGRHNPLLFSVAGPRLRRARPLGTRGQERCDPPAPVPDTARSGRRGLAAKGWRLSRRRAMTERPHQGKGRLGLRQIY